VVGADLRAARENRAANQEPAGSEIRPYLPSPLILSASTSSSLEVEYCDNLIFHRRGALDRLGRPLEVQWDRIWHLRSVCACFVEAGFFVVVPHLIYYNHKNAEKSGDPAPETECDRA